MSVSFDIKLQAKDLYRFNIYQTYRGVQGWVSILLAILLFAMAGLTWGQTEVLYTVLYIGGGILLICYIPLSLWIRVNATIRANTVLSNTLHYEVSEECIRVTQGEEAGELPWDAVYKMVSNRKQILIYSTRVNAYIIPREQITGQYDALRDIAVKKLEKFRVNLKE